MPSHSLAAETGAESDSEPLADCACFHCGLPVPDYPAPPSLDVSGTERWFCCHGCQAVCEAILGAGLGDYYRHRTEAALTANRQTVPDFLLHLDIYDRAEIQKDFVKAEGDWREASLLLEGIRCAACLWLNERHLRHLPGVIDVGIDETMQRARVRWDPARIKLSEILRAITDIGYIARPYDVTRSEQLLQERRRRSAERLIFAGMVGMMVMNFSVATYFKGAPDAHGQLPLWVIIGRWTTLMITTLILAYPGQEFFTGAWRDLRSRRAGMDIPVVLGLTAAFAGSLYATIVARGEVYFDSIAMFVFFLLLARRWEMRGRLQAADRLDRLAHTTPRSVRRLNEDGHCDEVPASDLVAGDQLRVLPGETLAVDGVLVTGSSSFDESLLTGEVSPVLRRAGDRVVAGSVNGEQPVVIRVTHGVQASTVSEIRRLAAQGLEQRPRVAELAEQAARWFIAGILVIAGATALYWLWVEPARWLSSTIAVLIITCPCALALATPVALAVAAGRFVELGVLPLRMRALYGLATSDVVAFDKTGTLTSGRLGIAAVLATAGLDRYQCLRYAAALSVVSEHPVARALREAVPKTGLVIGNASNVPGSGIEAMIAGELWRLGSPGFAAGESLLAPAVRNAIKRQQDKGRTVSVLCNAQGVQAVFSFTDPLRQGTADMLARMRALGVDSFAILSGDTLTSVSRLGQQLKVDDLRGELSPRGKLQWMGARQKAGHRVTMLGDGINDAPVLAAADASVSFSDATDLANVSSDFLLLGTDIGVLADARRIARRTRRTIVQNLAWAAAYNVLAVPLAAAGWIPPWAAAIGMSFSSLFVVLNSLRLQQG
jgi:P-type Cu2+ transporter